MNKKKKYLNLLRASVNALNSSVIMDELGLEYRQEVSRSLAEKNIDKANSLMQIVEETKQKSREYVCQHADLLRAALEESYNHILNVENKNSPVEVIEAAMS
jgi:hypothetical protein